MTSYVDRQPGIHIRGKRWTKRGADTVVRKKKKTKETSARGPQRWPQRAISLWELLLLLFIITIFVYLDIIYETIIRIQLWTSNENRFHICLPCERINHSMIFFEWYCKIKWLSNI